MHLSRGKLRSLWNAGSELTKVIYPTCSRLPSSSYLSTSARLGAEAEKEEKKSSTALVKPTQYFQELAEAGKDKETFHKAIGLFLQNNNRRRGHVEFIYAALKCMKEFGVEKDLDTYKALLNVFPKGTMIPKNMWLADQWYYPRQQECCIEVLDEMEWNGVFIDKEVYVIVKNAFGEWGQAGKKIQKQLYWGPKFKHMNPFKLPRPVPDDSLKLAVLALKMMCRDPATSISTTIEERSFADVLSNLLNWDTSGSEGALLLFVYLLKAPLGEAKDDLRVWIASGQAPQQQELIAKLPRDRTLYVDGPYLVWVRDKQVQYFMLSTDPDEKKVPQLWEDLTDEGNPETWKNWKTNFSSMYSDRRRALLTTPSIHEIPEGTILALGATQNSSKDSAAAWLSFLQQRNPRLLDDLPVLFRIKHISSEIAVTSEGESSVQERTDHSSQ